jgi:hypothetical protein
MPKQNPLEQLKYTLKNEGLESKIGRVPVQGERVNG